MYTIHVMCQDIDGGATEADGEASAPVGPSVATPLVSLICICQHNNILRIIGLDLDEKNSRIIGSLLA